MLIILPALSVRLKFCGCGLLDGVCIGAKLDKQLQGWLDQVKKEREKQSQADEKGAPHVRAIISP